jgi:hypothetical protein
LEKTSIEFGCVCAQKKTNLNTIIFSTRDLIGVLHPHNNGTTTPYMGGPYTHCETLVRPTPCEGLLYHCCVGVV